MLDDWGKERTGFQLYRWINDSGYQFPRAEVFGYDLEGIERQYFLRELELSARYACYGYTDEESPLSSGILISAVILLSNEVNKSEPVVGNKQVNWPLQDADVEWWLVHPDSVEEFTKNYLKTKSG